MMKKFLYLKPLIVFFIIGLLITTLSRLFLMFYFSNRVFKTENFGYIFPIGLRLDIITLCYISFLPLIIISITPEKWNNISNKIVGYYFILFLLLIFFMEIATPNFMVQFDTRPNRLFLDYLIYPKEIIGTLLKSFLFSMIFTLIIMGVSLFFIIKYSSKLFETKPTPLLFRILFLPVIGFFLFWGARSSLTSKRPINASNAVFSHDQFTNCLGLNSFYTVMDAAYTIKNETNVDKMYGKMEIPEALSRVKKYMTSAPEEYLSADLPTLHQQAPTELLERPYNLVIFLQESLGAEYVSCLGGLPLTPEIDKLSKEGMLFTNLFCTGIRSARGIEAVISGFLPSPSESVLKMSKSQKDFYTLAQTFKKNGYDTSFLYGGMSNFDNMAAFFNGNGFDNIIDEVDLSKNATAQKGIWGFSDEYLVEKANEYFVKKQDKPFFSLMFSTSNHDPFQFPDGRIELYEQPKNTVNNAIKYADYAIGKFFEMAKKEAYYKNTVFIIIADHNTRTKGEGLVPIKKFHIPALIIGPSVKPGQIYSKLCSQIDIAPTLLALVGMKVVTPMVGRNLMQLPENAPGRAIMQFFNNNAFRVDNQVVILQPNTLPLQFEVTNQNEMIPTKLDNELARDALAHLAIANYLYLERKYKDNKDSAQK